MNAFNSELLKLRTTRSSFALLIVMLATGLLVVVGTIGSGIVGDATRPASELLSAIATGMGVFATILGIIVVTNEYRHGTITPTFLVTPRRERVIAAKILAGALAGLVISALLLVLALAIGIPWLSARDEALGLDGELALAAIQLVATIVLSVLFGVAVGTLIHSQIGAIVATFAWFLILEGVLSLLAGWLVDFDRDPLGPYLPGRLFGALSGVENEDDVRPAVAFALLVLYTATLAAAGTVFTLRRDAD